ncbi:hypothetical protein Mapa_007464 [Marchantia paleacea]|nr:hypothetical protein Mapa_007464 [Marchantia paleacea]
MLEAIFASWASASSINDHGKSSNLQRKDPALKYEHKVLLLKSTTTLSPSSKSFWRLLVPTSMLDVIIIKTTEPKSRNPTTFVSVPS